MYSEFNAPHTSVVHTFTDHLYTEGLTPEHTSANSSSDATATRTELNSNVADSSSAVRHDERYQYIDYEHNITEYLPCWKEVFTQVWEMSCALP